MDIIKVKGGDRQSPTATARKKFFSGQCKNRGAFGYYKEKGIAEQLGMTEREVIKLERKLLKRLATL